MGEHQGLPSTLRYLPISVTVPRQPQFETSAIINAGPLVSDNPASALRNCQEPPGETLRPISQCHYQTETPHRTDWSLEERPHQGSTGIGGQAIHQTLRTAQEARRVWSQQVLLVRLFNRGTV